MRILIYIYAGDSVIWASNDYGSTAGEKHTCTKVERT